MKCTPSEGQLEFLTSIKSERKKLSVVFWRRDAEGVCSSHEILVIFSQGQTGEIPLVPFIIVIVYPGSNHLKDLRKAGATRQVDLVFHMAEEALLGTVKNYAQKGLQAQDRMKSASNGGVIQNCP